jgi:hypothetical protein
MTAPIWTGIDRPVSTPQDFWKDLGCDCCGITGSGSGSPAPVPTVFCPGGCVGIPIAATLYLTITAGPTHMVGQVFRCDFVPAGNFWRSAQKTISSCDGTTDVCYQATIFCPTGSPPGAVNITWGIGVACVTCPNPTVLDGSWSGGGPFTCSPPSTGNQTTSAYTITGGLHHSCPTVGSTALNCINGTTLTGAITA